MKKNRERVKNIAGIILGICMFLAPAFLVVGTQILYSPIDENEAISFSAHFEGMEGVVTRSDLLYVGFSDHESVTVRWNKSEVIDSLASVEPGTELTVLVHPKSDYAMSIQSEDKIICDFNNTLEKMESERKVFLYLVAGIYSLFLVVVIWTVLEYGRNKRKRQTAEKNRKYCWRSKLATIN